MKTYQVKEIFFSLQGEGIRAGTANLFLRFAGCNRLCTVEADGFDCDTDFAGGDGMALDEIVAELRRLGPGCDWIVLTGGEPGLQVDRELIDGLHEAGFQLAIETNGTVALPEGLDWITVSPKDPDDQIRQRRADELKIVRARGQDLPESTIEADHYLVSPAFDGDRLDPATLAWCIELVQANPRWRLSVQMHKAWRIR